jgi:hypothetical protein
MRGVVMKLRQFVFLFVFLPVFQPVVLASQAAIGVDYFEDFAAFAANWQKVWQY